MNVPGGSSRARNGRKKPKIAIAYVPIPVPGFKPSRWLVDVDGPAYQGRCVLEVYAATVGVRSAKRYHARLTGVASACTLGTALYTGLRIGMHEWVWIRIQDRQEQCYGVVRILGADANEGIGHVS